MPHHKQSPKTRTPVPAPIAITAMVGAVLAFAALALAALFSEPSPIVIELAPQDFAANNNDDRFDHTHGHDLTAPDGTFLHLERNAENPV